METNGTSPTYTGNAPHAVDRPVMVHTWEQLTFIHWSYEVDEVQRLLPPGLTVQPFEGKAWVGLVPFLLTVRLPGTPVIPRLARFPETNVRTYVTDVNGKPGVWFISLDADRVAAVATARATYRLPYFWSAMSISRNDNEIEYASRRRWPGPKGASCKARVRIGQERRQQDLTQLDHFLTARWALFSAHHRGLHYADAFHEPWPLNEAELLDLDETLVVAGGLSRPTGDPVVHFSPKVEVTIGLPHRVSKVASLRNERDPHE